MAASTGSTDKSTISLPYMHGYGSITKALERIQTAAVPDRFTQDFLAAKLALKGGTPKPVIPFLKRTGFLSGDGSPTDIYKEFRNESLRGAAAARAVRKGFAPLYEINEYAHDLTDKELKGLIVQATGMDAGSGTVASTLGSFKALKAFADFDASEPAEQAVNEESGFVPEPKGSGSKGGEVALKLGYTINLNLPATTDVAVFNAIFKSLREHLLDK